MAVHLRSSGPYPTPDDEIYSKLIDTASNHAIFALDRHGRILTWNRGASRIYGYDANEIVGRNYSLLYTPDDNIANKPEDTLESAMDAGVFTEEGWRLRKGGDRFWASVTVNPLTDEVGNISGFGLITQDLNERKLADQQLEMYRTLASHVEDYAIFLLDPTGRVITWSTAAERMMAYRPEEIIGQHFSRFYIAEDLAEQKPARELEIASRQGKYEEEGWRVRKDGSRLFASIVITALRNNSGELIGFGKITRDLTERRLAEERLASYARKLETARDEAIQASTLKSQFVANVSHEIRTPMSGLLGMAELLQYEELSASAKEMVAHIHTSAKNLLDILNDLLDFSKIEAGRMVLEKRPVDMDAVVSNVLSTTEVSAAQKGLHIVAAIDQNLPQGLIGDPLRLQQIILNLVSNSIKFTAKGSVKVGVSKADESDTHVVVRVEVSDTGIGIPVEKHRLLFEPFVQVDGSMTRRYGGTGLGLSICKRLVDLMGGQIGLRSKENVGSTFWFAVPLEKAEAGV